MHRLHDLHDVRRVGSARRMRLIGPQPAPESDHARRPVDIPATGAESGPDGQNPPIAAAVGAKAHGRRGREPLGVDRTGVPMEIECGLPLRGIHHIHVGCQPGLQATGELQHRHSPVIRGELERLAVLGRAIGQEHATAGGDLDDRAEPRRQQRQRINTHIEHGTSRVERHRIRMPGFNAPPVHRGVGDARRADPAFPDEFPRGLLRLAEPGDRRATEAQPPGLRQVHHFLRLGISGRQRLLRVHVLAGLQALGDDLNVSLLDGEIDNRLDRGIGENLVERSVGAPAVLLRPGLRAGGINVAGPENFDFRPLAHRVAVGPGDVAAAHHHHAQRRRHFLHLDCLPPLLDPLAAFLNLGARIKFLRLMLDGDRAAISLLAQHPENGLDGHHAVTEPAGLVSHVDERQARFLRAPGLHILQVKSLQARGKFLHCRQRIPALRGAPARVERHPDNVLVAGPEPRPHLGGAFIRMILDAVRHAVLAQDRHGGRPVLDEKLDVTGDDGNIQCDTEPTGAVQVAGVARHPRRVAADGQAVFRQQGPGALDMLQRRPSPVQMCAPEVDRGKAERLDFEQHRLEALVKGRERRKPRLGCVVALHPALLHAIAQLPGDKIGGNKRQCGVHKFTLSRSCGLWQSPPR